MKLSNNSSFVILIFAILKYRSFYISSFQFWTPIPVSVRAPGEVLVAEGIRVAEDIRVPEYFWVPEISGYSTEKN